MQHIIELELFDIVIQACTEKWANVGIFDKRKGGKSLYQVVDPSELKRLRSLPLYPTQMNYHLYDNVLADNEEIIRGKIHSLNT
jgi:hypothetical protein